MKWAQAWKRAAKRHYWLHGVAASQARLSWDRYSSIHSAAEKAREALQAAGDCCDHASNCCADWCADCRSGKEARVLAFEALDALDEALGKKP